MMHAYKASRHQASARAQDLPREFLLSDPVRNPDIVQLAHTAPAGTGLIYRHFGESGRFAKAREAQRVAHEHGVLLLASLDLALVTHIALDGMHVPEKHMAELPRLRRRFPHFLLTCASHSGRKARRAFALGADAVLLSPVFPSHSPSAGRPLGLCRTLRTARSLPGPLIALGGITSRDIPLLRAHNITAARVSGQRKSKPGSAKT